MCRVKGSNYSNYVILLLGIIKGINKGIKRRELEFSFYELLRREGKEEKSQGVGSSKIHREVRGDLIRLLCLIGFDNQ